MTATPFQLESLTYQTDAVDAVVRVFDGTPKTQVHELAGILIEGARLAALMIEHNLGVSTAQTFALKRLDTDFFEED